MADTFTTNYNWRMPEDGASANTWGDKWNTNLGGVGGIDAMLRAVEIKADDSLKIANTLSEFDNDTKKGNARTALQLVPGTHIMAYSAFLANLAAISQAANRIPVMNGTDAWGYVGMSAKGQALVTAADAAAIRSAADLRIGTTKVWVQGTAPDSPATGDLWVW